MKILILNQYFPPDQAATGQLLGQLAEDLSIDHEVTVVCGQPTYAPSQDQQVFRPQLKIHRTPLFPFSRANLFVRILNYFLFLIGATIKAITLPKHDVVMAWTDPPLVGLIAILVKNIRECRFLFVSQDVYPEIAIAARKMNNPVSVLILRSATKTILKAADKIVAVGDDMKKRLIERGCSLPRIEVIPNWQDTDALSPTLENPFRQTQDIPQDAFVVMHSGNIGFSQDFDALLGAAELTKDRENIRYVIIGDGSKRNDVAKTVEQRGLQNVRLFPYQPASRLSFSLGAADLHYVSLKAEFAGYVVPSKIFGILAVGRPVITNLSPDSYIEKIVRAAGCGVICNAEPEKLAEKIVELSENRETLATMGEAGRQWSDRHGGRFMTTQRYERLLRGIRSS